MNKTIYFINGMPQAGSSLLACILAQNPRFECSLPGGLLDNIYNLTKVWQEIPEFKTSLNEAGKLGVMRGMLQGYFAASNRPVAFEKSRAWLAHLETAELILGRPVRVLVPVRDLREILAGFELLWRHNSAFSQTPLEKKYYHDFQSAQGRCARWFSPDGPVGLAYARLQDALHRKFRDRLHFIQYDDLTHRPVETLNKIHGFLDEPHFTYDLNHIRQIVPLHDPVYGFPICHHIKPSLIPSQKQASAVLGPSAEKYKGPYVWDLAG